MSVASLAPRRSGATPLGNAELDLPALGRALWRNKRNILIPTALVALLTLVAVQLVTPKYLAESRVLIEGRDNVFMRPDADKNVVDRNDVDEQAVTSQAQIILSRDLAIEVINKLKLGDRPEFDPALKGISPVRAVLGLLGLIRNPMSMTPEERVLEAYYDRLTVSPVEKSRVITIDFLSEDPELAPRVANAIAAAYLERQRGAKQDQAKTAANYLSGEIDSMRKKVADAEQKVEAFRAKTNLLAGINGTTLSAQQLSDSNGQLATSRAQKADAEAKAKMIRQMLHSGQTLESSDILNSDLFRRLSEQRVTLRAQLAEQSATLLDGHPRIKELKAQLADLDRQMMIEADAIARSLENDARLAAARMDAQAANLDQIKNQAATTNEQDVQLRALERDAKSQRDLLESYLAKYREAAARDTINSAPADARVISRATVSNVPTFPKKLPTLMIATLTTLILGAGFVVTRELMEAPAGAVPVRRAEEPDMAPRQAASRRPTVEPEIAPRQTAQQAAAPQATTNTPSHAASIAQAGGILTSRIAALVGMTRREEVAQVSVPIGAIEDVAYKLRQSGEGGARVAVFVTAGEADSGSTALRLARALAKDARVVLVGLNPGASAIKAASIDPTAGGLAELSNGTATFRNIIIKDTASSVHIVSAGRAPIERNAILSAAGMGTSFTALGRSYPNVVLDAGAASGADLTTLSRIGSQAILVASMPANAAVATEREVLLGAGFADVTVLAGARVTGDVAAA